MYLHVCTCRYMYTYYTCMYLQCTPYVHVYVPVSTCRYIQCTCILHAHVHVHCVFAEVEITVGHQTISE